MGRAFVENQDSDGPDAGLTSGERIANISDDMDTIESNILAAIASVDNLITERETAGVGRGPLPAIRKNLDNAYRLAKKANR